MRLIALWFVAAALAFPAYATNLIILSDEGWCHILLDGKEVGEIPLNDDKVILEGIYPGTYELKVHDAFDRLWYEDTLAVPDVENMVIQIEPDSFEVLASGFTSYKEPTPYILKKATTIRNEVKKYPISDLKSLLYITTEPENCSIWVEGRKVGTAPYVDFEPPNGSVELEIRRKGYEPVEETANIEEESVTHIHIEVE
ncbi:MAG: PEGA domain-containing protein [bacterium]|nr:PEGA domain-containing protein [bacterium]